MWFQFPNKCLMAFGSFFVFITYQNTVVLWWNDLSWKAGFADKVTKITVCLYNYRYGSLQVSLIELASCGVPCLHASAMGYPCLLCYPYYVSMYRCYQLYLYVISDIIVYGQTFSMNVCDPSQCPTSCCTFHLAYSICHISLWLRLCSCIHLHVFLDNCNHTVCVCVCVCVCVRVCVCVGGCACVCATGRSVRIICLSSQRNPDRPSNTPFRIITGSNAVVHYQWILSWACTHSWESLNNDYYLTSFLLAVPHDAGGAKAALVVIETPRVFYALFALVCEHITKFLLSTLFIACTFRLGDKNKNIAHSSLPYWIYLSYTVHCPIPKPTACM